jgi:hypothetical protein
MTNAPAGYSGTPLPRKLGIRDGDLVLLLQAPRGPSALLGRLPGASVRTDARGKAAFDVIVFFPKSAAELRRRFPALARRITQAGGLWIAWPKKSSGVDSDLVEDVVREIGLAAGLVDNKVCAIDATWSGLRFVIRRADRR